MELDWVESQPQKNKRNRTKEKHMKGRHLQRLNSLINLEVNILDMFRKAA
jgi:hypothetical protein